jgi:hypothetical protein
MASPPITPQTCSSHEAQLQIPPEKIPHSTQTGIWQNTDLIKI